MPVPSVSKQLLALSAVSMSSCGSELSAIDPPQPPAWERYVPTAAPSGFILRDLGELELDENGTTPFSVELSEETQAVFLMVAGRSGESVVLTELLSPSGEAWVEEKPAERELLALDGYFGGFAWAAAARNRIQPGNRRGTFMLPSSPDLSLERGKWTARVGAFEVSYSEERFVYERLPARGAVRVAVLERRAPVNERGRLGLRFLYSGSDGLNSSTARSDPRLNSALERVRSVFEPAGITLDEAVHLDLPASSLRRVELVGPACSPGAAVERLLDLAPADDRSPRVDVYFVEQFRCLRAGGQLDAGENLVGISNGIPGSPLGSGDGVLMATRHLDQNQALWSLALAHELGHFLGLFHARELGFDFFDTISDTPDDERARHNLMFGQVDEGDELSPLQGRLLRTSPLLRPPD